MANSPQRDSIKQLDHRREITYENIDIKLNM